MADRGRKPVPKSQREISQEGITPYSSIRNNPNELSSTGRGYKFSFRGDTVKPFSIGIQDIDESIMYYFDKVIQPSVMQNGKRIPVPVIYGAPERWKSVQADGYYRDRAGKIMSPLIMFKRNTITKNRSISNKLDANFPQNFGVFKKRYSPSNFYDNFSVLNNRIPDQTYYAVIVPDYVTLTYNCIISTYYVEQLNKIIEAVNYASDSYWGDPQKFKFATSIDQFSTTTELSVGSERIVRAEFEMTLKGYIIPDTIQKDLASIKKFSDKSKIIFDVEVVDDLNVLDGIVDTDRIDSTQDSDDLELNSPSTNLQTP
jgi:hypothetical protein